MLTLALTLSAKLFISLSSNSSAPPTLPLGRWLPSKAKTTSVFSSYRDRTQAYSCKIKEAKQTSNITRSESSDIATEGDFTQRWLWIKSTLGKGGSLGRQTQISERPRFRYVSIWGAKPGRSHEQRIVRSHLHNLTHSLKDFRAKERLRAVYGKQTTITTDVNRKWTFCIIRLVVWLKLSGKSSL